MSDALVHLESVPPRELFLLLRDASMAWVQKAKRSASFGVIGTLGPGMYRVRPAITATADDQEFSCPTF